MNLIQKLSLNNLLWIILGIHSMILIVIINEYIKDKKSIHYPITRFQLLFVIILLWISLYSIVHYKL